MMIDAQRLKEAREAKGMSQARLGKATGTSQQLVGHLESGAVRTTKAIFKFADVLGIPTFICHGAPPEGGVAPMVFRFTRFLVARSLVFE